MRRILRGSAALRSDPLKTDAQTPDCARMENISPIDIVIALTVLGAMIAILHAVAADISYTHLRIDLARRVIERRERYLRELRGEHELGEVEILEEDNPGMETSEIAPEVVEEAVQAQAA